MSLISATAQKLKKTIKTNGVQVTTTEETAKRKQGFLSILDDLAEKYSEKVKKDKINIHGTMDLERLIKLTLLLSGEPESVTSQTGVEQVEQGFVNVEKVLDPNDPLVNEIYQRLLHGYNDENDEAGRTKDF